MSSGKIVRVGLCLIGNPDFIEEEIGFLPGVLLGSFSDHELGNGNVLINVFMGKKIEGLEDHSHFSTDFIDIGFRAENIDTVNDDMA